MFTSKEPNFTDHYPPGIKKQNEFHKTSTSERYRDEDVSRGLHRDVLQMLIDHWIRSIVFSTDTKQYQCFRENADLFWKDIIGNDVDGWKVSCLVELENNLHWLGGMSIVAPGDPFVTFLADVL